MVRKFGPEIKKPRNAGLWYSGKVEARAMAGLVSDFRLGSWEW